MKLYPSGPSGINGLFMMYLSKWKRVTVFLLLVWIVVTYLVISPLRCEGSSEETADFQERLKTVSQQLESLKQQHSNLISQIRKSSGVNLNGIDTSAFHTVGGPTEEYENLRRRVYSNTQELWYFVNHELTKLINDDVQTDKIKSILDQVADRKRSLLSDQEKLSELDGYHEWRVTEAANVSDLVQRRLKYLQNPSDCKDARKVICNLNKIIYGLFQDPLQAPRLIRWLKHTHRQKYKFIWRYFRMGPHFQLSEYVVDQYSSKFQIC